MRAVQRAKPVETSREGKRFAGPGETPVDAESTGFVHSQCTPPNPSRAVTRKRRQPQGSEQALYGCPGLLVVREQRAYCALVLLAIPEPELPGYLIQPRRLAYGVSGDDRAEVARFYEGLQPAALRRDNAGHVDGEVHRLSGGDLLPSR